jgi:hypothetical protein
MRSRVFLKGPAFDRLKGTFSILSREVKEKMDTDEDCRFGEGKMLFQFYL